MEDTNQRFCWGHEWSPPTRDIQGNVCSAVTAYTVLLQALRVVSCDPHTNSRRQLLVSLFCRGNSRGLKRRQNLQSPGTRSSHPAPHQAPCSCKAPVGCLVPHHSAEDGDCHCRISHRHKAHSPLITDFITLETGSLGRKKIADCWSLPFQEAAGREGTASLFDSRDLTICVASDSQSRFSLSAAQTARPGQGQTKFDPEIG